MPLLPRIPPSHYYVTNELLDEVILARDWMLQHGAIVNNMSDCLYIELTERHQVFALPVPTTALFVTLVT